MEPTVPSPKVDPQSLVPSHLLQTESSADLKSKVADQLAATEARPDSGQLAAMRERVWTFPFKFVDGNGKVYEGTFTNKVPDIRTRQAIGVLRAQMSGGLPVEGLDQFTRDVNMMIAHLTFTLTDDATRPAWSKDLRSLDNPAVLFRLWEVVAEHEATFLG